MVRWLTKPSKLRMRHCSTFGLMERQNHQHKGLYSSWNHTRFRRKRFFRNDWNYAGLEVQRTLACFMADITNCSKNYISHNYSVRVYFLSVSAYNFLPFYYLTSLQCQGYETFTCTIYLSRFEYGSSRVFYCNYSTQIKWYDGSNMIIPMFNFERFIIMNYTIC